MDISSYLDVENGHVSMAVLQGLQTWRMAMCHVPRLEVCLVHMNQVPLLTQSLCSVVLSVFTWNHNAYTCTDRVAQLGGGYVLILCLLWYL